MFNGEGRGRYTVREVGVFLLSAGGDGEGLAGAASVAVRDAGLRDVERVL